MKKIAINLETQKRNASRSLPVNLNVRASYTRFMIKKTDILVKDLDRNFACFNHCIK
jgi:hypothetical protein